MSSIEYCPLHTHTTFSTLDGLPKVDNIIDRVTELGQKGFAVTDHGSMSGIPQFYQAAQKAGLTFAPGIEMYFTHDRKLKTTDFYGQKYYHLILMAHSNAGYANLSRLQRECWFDGYYYKPRADFELLEKFSEGITATTACLGSVFNQALLRGDRNAAEKDLATLVDIYGRENVYVEVQNHGSEEDKIVIPGQLEIAKKMNVELLATNDSHYCSPDDYSTHDLLLCTATGSRRDDEKRFRFDSDQFYMKSTDEMLALFPEDTFPGAVANTAKFIDKVDFSLPVGDKMKYLMPHVPEKMLDGMSESERLRERVFAGLSEPSRYGDENGDIPDNVRDMAEYELGVIENMGFPGYFLVTKRIIDLFHENGISTGAGRGSAPGSLVTYSLGITSIDPLEHDLLFWRFLSPDRISMPDIDTDIPKSKRQLALSLLEDEFGKDKIAQLTTYSEMKDKDAIQRAAKSIGYPAVMSDIFKKKTVEAMELIGEDFKLNDFNKLVIEFLDENESVPGRANSIISDYIQGIKKDFGDFEEILRVASDFVDVISSYGVHACGLLITPMPIDDLIPVRSPRKNSGTLPVAQYDGHDSEAMGAVKMDLLGIQTLDVCEDTERNVREDLGVDVDSSNLEPDDKEVYDMLSKGEGKGVFQMSCVTGDTALDNGMRISDLYRLHQRKEGPGTLRSVRFNTGAIEDNIIRKVVRTGEKQVYRMTTRSGKSIRATAEHRFFTPSGWKELGELDYGDTVLVMTDGRYSYPHRLLTSINKVSLVEAMTGQKWEDPMGGSVIIDSVRYPLAAVSPDDSKGIVTYIGNDSRLRQRANSYSNIKIISETELVEEYGREAGVDPAIPMCSDWTMITGIEDAGVEETFDISMAGPFHNYIADGFVVHNSGGMRSLLKEIKPTAFNDIVAVGALYRPGPMGMGSHTAYARRKNGLEETTYLHPDAEEIMSDTFGLCLTGDMEVAVIDETSPAGLSRVKIKDLGDIENPVVIGVDESLKGTPAEVSHWWSLGYKDTWQLILANFTKLRGSFDHPVLTGHGWKRLSEVTRNDVIATVGSEPSDRAFAGVRLEDVDGDFADVAISGVVPEEYVTGLTDVGWASWEPVSFSGPTGMKEEVYDISVPDTGTFLAESVVTHNCVYQEQIMQLSRKFADFTGGEADELRKAMGKKIKSMMDAQHDKFVSAVNAKYPEKMDYLDGDGKTHKGKLGDAWWAFIEPAASYLFNKSHAVAYAVLSYRTAWLKCHYPAQFGAAIIDIDSQGSDNNKKAVPEHIDWLNRFSITVRNPDINKSGLRGTTTKDSITLPLQLVRGIGENRARAIVDELEKNGPFESVVDAVERCKLNGTEIKNLSLAGAFESFGADRFRVVNVIDDIIDDSKRLRNHRTLETSVFSFGVTEEEFEPRDLKLGERPDYCDLGDDGPMEVESMSLRKIENSVMGLSVQPSQYTSFAAAAPKLQGKFKHKMINPDEASEYIGKTVCLYGIMSDCVNKLSGKGKPYSMFGISSIDTTIKAIRFSETKADDNDEFPIIATGRLEEDSYREGEFKFIVDSMKSIRRRKKK